MVNNVDKRRIVNAEPSKDFFISMLVRDIPLIDAVVDLVDNSVDGAIRLRRGKSLENLNVRLQVNQNLFKIIDNCGGIDIDLARDYAFKFGRPADFPDVPRSLGQFGVGMKRAFFKIGTRFKVESKTTTSRFVIDVDVEKWKNQKEWNFEFLELDEENEIPIDQAGTEIDIFPLHKAVEEMFALENFINRLRDRIETRHMRYLERGLIITINQVPVGIRPLQLISSNQIKTGYKEIKFTENLPKPVYTKLYAGIAESDPQSAGWHIFCNGRLILESDKSLSTGWGELRGTRIPRFHPQYNRFRGYVFFESDDAGLLPWNTTKTDVVADSQIYSATRQEMMKLARPVITFLNKLKSEKDGVEREGADPGPLEKAVDKAEIIGIDRAKKSQGFVAPKPERKPQGPKLGRILYYKPKDKINNVKAALKARTQEEVGEMTFDYFYDLEVDI